MRDVACQSRIARVQVYARGAVVTRVVDLPADLPRDAVVLRIGGLSPLAEAGSVRAAISGRDVVALRTRLVVPQAPAGPGDALERLRELDLERRSLEVARAHAEWRRNLVAERELKTGLDAVVRARPRGPGPEPVARTRDALAISGLVAEITRGLESRIGDLDDALERNAREREIAQLAAAQAKSSELAGAGHPTAEVVVGLGPASGEAAAALEIAYAIGAARWWPAYAARLTDAGARAAWSLDALVAQASGEDWTGVRLALSTADLVHDARLPELPSLRLGRAQAARHRGYRPPPPDLDALFEPHDRALADLHRPGLSTQEVARSETTLEFALPPDDAAVDLDEVTPVTAAGYAPPPAAAGAVPKDLARRPVPARQGPPPPQSFAPPGAGAPLAARPKALAAPDTLPLPDARRQFAAAQPFGIEPADAWLDFDSLVIAASEDMARRGRLIREAAPHAPAMPSREAAVSSIEALPDPLHARDPLWSRGRFDCRYEARGQVDIPSNARPHRVTLLGAEALGRALLRTVPRQTAEVFREVEMDNPFDAPLLAGPVDVFVEGALVATSPIAAVDRGGLVRLGLGVEERVRVARNARTEEGTAGLLGGSTAIDHAVTIDLRSSLGHRVSVDVVDRVPVTDDPDVEITLGSTRPEPVRYDQADRGEPVRGGLRWRIDLPPGGEARVELHYRVKLPASSEVIGGNRRE